MARLRKASRVLLHPPEPRVGTKHLALPRLRGTDAHQLVARRGSLDDPRYGETDSRAAPGRTATPSSPQPPPATRPGAG